MVEDKSNANSSAFDPIKDVPSATSSEPDNSPDMTEDEAPISRAPNSAALVLSWGVFSIGLYFFYAAGMGYYGDNVAEVKLAVTILLAILTIPVGIFLRRVAYQGFSKAFKDLLASGGDSTAGGY